MLETAICDGLEKLRLQEKVAETGRVNTDITALALVGASSRDGQIALLSLAVRGSSCAGSACSAVGGLELLVGVIDEVFLARHGGSVCVVLVGVE